MTAPQNIIAVVFDFDDTLTDDSTTALIKSVGIDPVEFWSKKAKALIDDGWAPTPAYLKLLLDNVGDGKPFGKLTNAKLREFGAKLRFYPGLPGLFKDLRLQVAEHKLSSPGIEFYVVSGGLEEVIKGSSLAKYLNGIWGCQFAEHDGQIAYLKNIVSFTEKTKYLFQINKGLEANKNPYAVNERVETAERRVPFENMIYVGDGFTDVPCFSLLAHFKGTPFGVFDPKKADAPKKAWEKLVTPKRVTSMNAPRYRKTDELGSLLRAAVAGICLKMDARTKTAMV
jgi:phosphoglycolate phosphatase-like HAD superfamily hydrolase